MAETVQRLSEPLVQPLHARTPRWDQLMAVRVNSILSIVCLILAVAELSLCISIGAPSYSLVMLSFLPIGLTIPAAGMGIATGFQRRITIIVAHRLLIAAAVCYAVGSASNLSLFAVVFVQEAFGGILSVNNIQKLTATQVLSCITGLLGIALTVTSSIGAHKIGTRLAASKTPAYQLSLAAEQSAGIAPPPEYDDEHWYEQLKVPSRTLGDGPITFPSGYYFFHETGITGPLRLRTTIVKQDSDPLELPEELYESKSDV